ncbi:Copper transporter 6 [Glycine soja]|uniref:Copper transport protein n=1 Tax=Glycine soja TaxID=3848 RepID=A0A445M1C8_GLYSO|nr:Copper transporter 6 [Glycine soja]
MTVSSPHQSSHSLALSLPLFRVCTSLFSHLSTSHHLIAPPPHHLGTSSCLPPPFSLTSEGDDMPMSNGRDHNSMKMHMSLYWGKDAIVLFSGWPKHSVGHYILAILFVFFLAIIAEVVSNKPNIKRGTNPIIGGLAQATFYVFRISLLYLVMLAVMSFNLGIFIAAVAGHTLGFFLAKSRALALANREQESSSDAQKV